MVLCVALRGKKENVNFLSLKTYEEDKLRVFSRTIIWLQLHRVKVFGEFFSKKKKKYYYICEEIIFVPRGIIIFSQFIVNLGFEYNLSVVISILL